MKTISILLVDDQAFVGLALRRLLATETDMTVHCCQAAAAAVQQAETLRPDVILQDLVMPDIDGLTLVERFRAHPAVAATPVIVLSGNEDMETRQRARAAGASDYLVKLPAKADLVACIRRHAAPSADPSGPLDQDVINGFRQGPPELASFTVSLIDQFVIEAQMRVDTLRAATARRDVTAIRAAAHSLKGSAHIMGARRLGILCGHIEDQAGHGSITQSLVAALDLELTEVRAAFAIERETFARGAAR